MKTFFWTPLLFGSIAACVLISGCLSMGAIPVAYKPGIYGGSGKGYRGTVYVELQISPSGIEDITITSHKESIFPGLAAMEELLDLVLSEGTTDIDAVSGATHSSRGFLDAVDDALAKAIAKAVVP